MGIINSWILGIAAIVLLSIGGVIGYKIAGGASQGGQQDCASKFEDVQVEIGRLRSMIAGNILPKIHFNEKVQVRKNATLVINVYSRSSIYSDTLRLDSIPPEFFEIELDTLEYD